MSGFKSLSGHIRSRFVDKKKITGGYVTELTEKKWTHLIFKNISLVCFVFLGKAILQSAITVLGSCEHTLIDLMHALTKSCYTFH